MLFKSDFIYFFLDHFPLLLDYGVVSRRSRYFKFENMWLKPKNFVEQMKIWWESYNFVITHMFST
jgi:hypothetical protein